MINPLYSSKLQFITSAPQLSIFDPELLLLIFIILPSLSCYFMV